MPTHSLDLQERVVKELYYSNPKCYATSCKILRRFIVLNDYHPYPLLLHKGAGN